MITLHDFWKCLGTAFGHFFFKLPQFHGLGSCVKRPSIGREGMLVVIGG